MRKTGTQNSFCLNTDENSKLVRNGAPNGCANENLLASSGSFFLLVFFFFFNHFGNQSQKKNPFLAFFFSSFHPHLRSSLVAFAHIYLTFQKMPKKSWKKTLFFNLFFIVLEDEEEQEKEKGKKGELGKDFEYTKALFSLPPPTTNIHTPTLHTPTHTHPHTNTYTDIHRHTQTKVVLV